MRATAIIAVVLYHAFTVPFGAAGVGLAGAAAEAGSGARALVQAVLAVLPGPDQLVVIFFTVAGYFAYRAYQRSQSSPSPRGRSAFVKFFLWRRFWRLVPVFWVALLFSYFVGFDHPFTWDGLRKLAVNASLLKTLYPGYFFSINHAHWYVAVQWQLDLLYPLFLFVVARRSPGFAVALAWAVSILLTFVAPQFTDAAFVRYFPLRWWAEWSLGAYLADRHLAGVRVFPRPGWTMVAALAAVALGHAGGVRLVEWFASRVLLGAAFEAMLLSRSPRRRWERWLAPIGLCSYSLYLVHLPVQDLVARVWLALGIEFSSAAAWAGFVLVGGALSFALARVLTQLVEQKTAALGNRLWRRRTEIRQRVRERTIRRLVGRSRTGPGRVASQAQP